VTGVRLAPADAPDSQALVAALLDRDRRGRAHPVEDASTLALVRGRRQLIAPGSRPARRPHNGDETGAAPRPQRYDLAADLGEQRDLASETVQHAFGCSGSQNRSRAARAPTARPPLRPAAGALG
jgi:hypothetical protein